MHLHDVKRLDDAVPAVAPGRIHRPFPVSFIAWCGAAFAALLIAGTAFAASNVVEYTYDSAGNIAQVKRQAAGGLAITGFDPANGPVGTAVTIYGAGFDPVAGNDLVKLNGTVAAVGAAAAGSLGVSVPAVATTGRITVTVGGTTATSAQDFIVTIPGVPTITSFTPASGVAGTSVAVSGTNFDPAAGATTVKLNGVTATASVTATTSLSFIVPGATASGRITATTSSGTGASAQDFLVPPAGVAASDIVAVVRLATGGSAANLVVSTPSRKGLILFDGNANAYYTLQFAQFASSPTSATIAYQVIKPDNTVLASGNVGNSNRPTIHLPKLPSSGTYSVLVSVGAATLNTNVRVTADPILSIDGPAVASSLDFNNQSMRFVFDATAGQRIGVGVMGIMGTPSFGNLAFSAYLPDGSTLYAPAMPYCAMPSYSNPQGNCDGELVAPVAGTYTLVGQSYWDTYDNFTIQLSSEVTGTLVLDAQQDVTLTRVGQDARYSFTAAAGDSLAIDVSGINPLPQAQYYYVTVYKPDGTYFVGCSATPPASIYCELGAAPVTGTYTVTVDPFLGGYGSFKLTLKQGLMLATTDAPTAFAPAAVAETARFRFSGTAGQNLTIGVASLAYVGSSGSSASLIVYRPDRTQVGSVSCSPPVAGGSCKITLANLPVTGVYSVVLVPPSGVKITGNVNLSSELTGTLTANSPVALNVTRAGQNARYTFAGTVGESTSVKLLAVSTAPAGQSVYATLYKPDGAYLTSGSGSSNGPAFLNLASLPSTGTYTVLVAPNYGVTWQAQLVLDPGALLAIDGATASLVTSATGETLRFRFNGTMGQRADFGLTGLTHSAASSSPSTLQVFRPDGTLIVWLSCSTSGAGSCDSSYASLPSTGSYSVLITPPAASSITGGTFAISTPLAGTFVVGDPAQTIAITRPGQTARYTFSGTAAQLLRLNWTGTTVSGGASVSVSVLKPDGTTLSSGSFLNGATGGLDIATLPTTGTYTLVFDPGSAATMTAPSTLVSR